MGLPSSGRQMHQQSTIGANFRAMAMNPREHPQWQVDLTAVLANSKQGKQNCILSNFGTALIRLPDAPAVKKPPLWQGDPKCVPTMPAELHSAADAFGTSIRTWNRPVAQPMAKLFSCPEQLISEVDRSCFTSNLNWNHRIVRYTGNFK